MTETQNTPRYTVSYFPERTNFRGATVAAQWIIMDGTEQATYHNSSKEIFTEWEAQNKADALNAKVAPAKVQTVTEDAATDAQVNYLLTLLPRYYEAQKADGITLATDLYSAAGVIDTTAIRALSKREASAWISAAKSELA